MHSSYSRWSGVLKSTSAMTKMTVEPVHRHSCANSSALPVQLVCGWPDVPCSGSGSPASRALPPETARKQPSEPPKIDLQGVDSIDEASDWTPRRIPLHPYPTMTQRQSNPTGERDRDEPGALRYATRLASAAQPHHHPPPRGVARVVARARRNNAKFQCKYMACEWTQMEICCTQSRA